MGNRRDPPSSPSLTLDNRSYVDHYEENGGSVRRIRPDRVVTLETVRPEELENLAHLRRARDLMDREYARPLDVAALARTALMSPAHFSRQFRAAYGETPYAYLMTPRLERALGLRRAGMGGTDRGMTVGRAPLSTLH